MFRKIRSLQQSIGFGMDIKHMRINYSSQIDLHQISQELGPFELFTQFFEQARENKQIIEANTMFISTCADNVPTMRPVLLKEIKNNQFIFFTNYSSTKGKQISQNKNVAACFYWEPLQVCVRIEGILIYICDKQVLVIRFPNKIRRITFNKGLKHHKLVLGHLISHQKSKIANNYWINMQNQRKNIKKNLFQNLIFGVDMPLLLQKSNIGEKSRLHQRVEFQRENTSQKWNLKLLSP